MRAGFGKSEIVFQTDMLPLEGFSGIHDNPHVGIMVIEGDTDQMALAVMELVNVPKRAIDHCREAISEEFGIPTEKIWVHMTHAITTPHEPGPMGPPDKRPPVSEEDLRKRALFYEAIETAVEQALKAARADFGEACFGWGTGECDANQNRDIETPYGWWVGVGGSGYSNKTMTVLKAQTPEGKTKGVLVSYGLKPCAVDNSGMKEGVRLISSEVCGLACVKAEDVLGAPVLFAMSAAGDQIPAKTSCREKVVDGEVLPDDDGVEAGFGYAEEISQLMKESMVAIANAAVCDIKEAEMGWERLAFEWARRKSTGRRQLTKVLEHEADGATEFQAQLFRFGDAVFVAEKAEVNAQTEKELMEQCPFRHMVFMSMVNGEMKYLPDQKSFDRGTWEAQSALLMPGAAEKFVEEAAKCMERLKQ